MLNEINFPEMLNKIKKFKDDMEHKITDLTIKMKKKIGTGDLTSLEQNMIEKIDKFLLEN
jgi:hypothetical protein